MISCSCPQCGKRYEVGDGAAGRTVDCSCGASFAAPGGATCRACGGPVEAGWRACPECGAALGAGTPAADRLATPGAAVRAGDQGVVHARIDASTSGTAPGARSSAAGTPMVAAGDDSVVKADINASTTVNDHRAISVHGQYVETQTVNVSTVAAEAVLDLQAQVRGQSEQVHEIGAAVQKLLDQHDLTRRELRPGDSLSIRTDRERELVKQVVARYRALPQGDRDRVPALLNAVGKLEVAAGDFDAARTDFRAVAAMEPDAKARAEAHHNAFRAALEERDWPWAVQELVKAVNLDPKRFAPFPTGKYQPVRILGAGGFGVAFLCRHKYMDARLVVKTLTLDDLGGDADAVFTEAQVLRQLDHPAVIRISDCGYVDPAKKARPFLVMDYFEGGTLEEYVQKHGPLPADDLVAMARRVAEGLHAAHGKGILHRDVKPANLLVRRESGGWRVKVIDFGLAVRPAPGPAAGGDRGRTYDSVYRTMVQRAGGSTSRRGRTLLGGSVAGTLDYGAPEQMGKRAGPVGPYSDVYGWARTCCYALFGTTQPTLRHWQGVPGPLADLLGRCLEDDPAARPRGFAEVLAGLDTLITPPPVPPTADRAFSFDGESAPRRRARPVKAKRKKSRLPLLVGGGAALAAVLVAVVLGVVLRSKPRPEAPSDESGQAVAGVPAEGQRPTARPADPEPVPTTVPVAQATTPPGTGTEWVRLFNGNDLDGWAVDGTPNPWTVGRGELACTGPAISRRGTLLTVREFADLALRFEFQLSAGGKGGVTLRALPGRKALLVYLADDGRGDDPAVRTGSLWWPENGGGPGGTRPPGRPARLRPVGEWNQAVLEVRGTLVRLTVNEEQVTWADLSVLPAARDTEALTRPRGRVGLQNHDDKVLRFRNVEVTDPSPATPTPAPSTPVVAVSPPADDAARLQGEWVCTHEEAGGRKAASPAELQQLGKTLTVKGNRFTIRRTQKGVAGVYDGEFVLNPVTGPKRFDFSGTFTPVGGKGVPVWFVGVYELSGDEFRFCYRRATTTAERQDRATDFTTRPGVILNTFRRVSSSPKPALPVGTWVEVRTDGAGERVREFRPDGTLILHLPRRGETYRGSWKRGNGRVHFSEDGKAPVEDKWFTIAKSDESSMTVMILGTRPYLWRRKAE